MYECIYALRKMWCNSRLLTLMSRGPAGGLTYTVLAGLRRMAWRGGVLSSYRSPANRNG